MCPGKREISSHITLEPRRAETYRHLTWTRARLTHFTGWHTCTSVGISMRLSRLPWVRTRRLLVFGLGHTFDMSTLNHRDTTGGDSVAAANLSASHMCFAGLDWDLERSLYAE